METDKRTQILEQFGQQLAPSYRFMVAIDGKPFGAFTECTLPSVEMNVEEVKEGGLNNYVHQLPGALRSARVRLKNGIGLPDYLLNLYRQALAGQLKRMTMTITLLNASLLPVLVIAIQNAYPVKWSGPDLRSDGNTVAIQTFELVCGDVTILG